MPPRRRRQKGTGAVRRLPSGRWQARVDDGSGALISIGSFPTKGDATQALLLARSDQARGQWVDPSVGRLMFGDYASDWLQHRSTIGRRTRELYDSLLRNHLDPTFADLALADITTRSVRRWHTTLLNGDQPGHVTIAKAYRLLRGILATAVDDGLIVKNPCAITCAGTERSPERPVATIAQVYALADAVDARYRTLILLATFASMRFGELAALTRRRIDLDQGLVSISAAANEHDDGTWTIGAPKTAAGRRTVAIPSSLVPELRTHLDQYSEPGTNVLVFVGPHGGPLRRSNWSKTWHRATSSLDLDHLHFHDLRHTGNTLAAATGASTKELMSRMGHASSRAALIYQHATIDRERVIAERLNAPPEGTHYRLVTRLAKFRNVPDLVRMFSVFADVRTKADLNLPVPALRNGHAEVVVVPGNDDLATYVADLGERAERVRNRGVDPTEDNMLKISSDGRAAALDVRLVHLDAPLGPTKVSAAAARIHAIWTTNRARRFTDGTGRTHHRPGALQLVFVELGTPGGARWGLYDELRRQLVERGMPAESVRFIHEARNAREKEQLFTGCRNGAVSVLVGTTEKMGVGTNVQARCVALHHLDCPWRPADVEQREGRILRQGNQNDVVDVLRYVTAGSFDVYMWLVNRTTGSATWTGATGTMGSEQSSTWR
jgi:integrase